MGACISKGKNITIKSKSEKSGQNQLLIKLKNKKRESSSSLEYEIPNNIEIISFGTLSSKDISNEINIKDINSIDKEINNNSFKEIFDIFYM